MRKGKKFLLLAGLLLGLQGTVLVSADILLEEEVTVGKEELSVVDTEIQEEKSEQDLDYILGRPMTEEEIRRQQEQEPNLPLQSTDDDDEVDASVGSFSKRRARQRQAIPDSYDGREYDYITAVKNQNPYGVCWAFTANALAETSMIRQGKADADIDYSELHTAYYFYNKTADRLGLTNGDRNIAAPGYDYRRNGGNNQMSAFFLSGWTGTELEENAPYEWMAESTPPFGEQQMYEAYAKLTNARFINKNETSQIKKAIMEYGAVGIMYYQDNHYFQYDTAAYCYGGTVSGTNHAVVLVGWDDSYSRENFISDSNVETDGAWIVKNSWGESHGDGGYFYMSYEEPTFGNVTAMEFEDDSRYQYNYHYDGSSLNTAYRAGENQAVSNIYEVTASGGVEVLQAVNIALRSVDTPYEIQIYREVSEADNPTSGEAVFAEPLTGITNHAGIYTIDLPQDIYLYPNTRFSVVITLPQGGEYYGETSGTRSWVSTNAVTDAGQSFWKNSKGYWQDLSNSNICARIKAFTSYINRPLLTADDASWDTALLRWDGVDEAEGYRIYRSESEDGGYMAIRNLKDPSVTQYKNHGLEIGKTYYYKIRGFYEDNGTTRYTPYSEVVSVTTKADTPVLSGSAAGVSTAKLTWEKISGASGYRIYRSTDKKSGYAAIRNLTDSSVRSYTNKNLSCGTTYYYKMRAFRKAGEKTYYSDYSKPIAVKPVPARVRIKKIQLDSGRGLQVTWERVSGVSGYRIYRSGKKDGSYSYLRTLTGENTVTFLDTTAKSSGKTYFYKVRAFRTVNAVPVYGAMSEVKSYTIRKKQ